MLKTLDFHKKLYDKRWNGELEPHEDMRQLDADFLEVAALDNVSDEKTAELVYQLYIPPYKYDLLPEHLRETNAVIKANPKHGGKREGAGRPKLGITKKVSITLPEEVWEQLEEAKGDKKMSALLREIILDGHWI